MSQDLMRAIGRLEGKIDGMIREQTRVSDILVAQEMRLAALEQHKARALGIGAGAGAVAGGVISAAKWILSG